MREIYNITDKINRELNEQIVSAYDKGALDILEFMIRENVNAEKLLKAYKTVKKIKEGENVNYDEETY